MTKPDYHTTLKAAQLDTQLGTMIAIGDDNAIYLLEFIDPPKLEAKLEKLKCMTKSHIISGKAAPIQSITMELKSYFDGTLTEFKTPLHLVGSPFQKLVWRSLMHVPYGHTQSYQAQAKAMGKETACRAVANANGANRLALVIPCHRIINSNGRLGGYSGGIERKQWLIDHEKRNVSRK